MNPQQENESRKNKIQSNPYSKPFKSILQFVFLIFSSLFLFFFKQKRNVGPSESLSKLLLGYQVNKDNRVAHEVADSIHVTIQIKKERNKPKKKKKGDEDHSAETPCLD